MFGVLFWIILVVVLLGGIIYNKRAKKLPGIPLASDSTFFFGHGLHLKNMVHKSGEAHRFYDWALENALKSEGKPYQISIPDRDPFIRLTSVESVQFILKDEFDKFVKMNNQVSHEMVKEFLGKGIFAADGEKWRFERKVASHMFSTHILDNVMCPIFFEHGETLLGILKNCSEKNETLDIQDYLKRFTMDSISQIAFGVHFNSLQMPVCDFSKAFDRIQEFLIRRSMKPEFMFYLQRWLKIGDEKKIYEDSQVINETVHKIIQQRNEKLEKEGGQKQNQWEDLLSQFILMKKKKGEKLDPEETRDIVMNFLIAGRDTTACLLTWTFYEMSRHPEMEEKILAEMNEVFRDAPVSSESVKHLKYTHNFLSEVLRLHPPVPFDSKKATEDITFPDGTHVPKDTICMYSPYIIGRLPWVWPDPEEFIPKRWEKDPNPSEYKFITFNAGPRICLGKRMAYLEAKILLSLLLPQYKIIVKQNQKFVPVLGLIRWFQDGLQVVIERRE